MIIEERFMNIVNPIKKVLLIKFMKNDYTKKKAFFRELVAIYLKSKIMILVKNVRIEKSLNLFFVRKYEIMYYFGIMLE